MKTRKLILGVTLTLISVVCLSAKPSRRTAACDQQGMESAKQEFLRLKDQRRERPEDVSEGQFREAAIRYIGYAEECYEAKTGDRSQSGILIDEGGMWFSPSGANNLNAATVLPDGPSYPRHNLTGTKWGSGSSFLTCCDNVNAHGPQLPGGTVTYSFMSDGVSLADDCGMGCTNTAISSLSTFQSCFMREIADALSAWSAVADIKFLPVNDGGLPFNSGTIGDIRIGAHPFDGGSGTLAHAFFPPPNGSGAAGDLHLDIAENWSCEPSQGSIDIGTVVLHELGHSLGLGHEVSDPAIMQPVYNPAYSFGPLADDIIGLGEIYGGSPVGKSFFFGDVGVGTDSPQTALHVKRFDGSAKILVEEQSPVTASRSLFELKNNGAAFFNLRNSNLNKVWSFSVSGIGTFQIDDPAVAGGSEMTLVSSGTLRVGPGGVQNLLLDPAGNLTIKGDLTANGVFYASDRDLKERLVPAESTVMLEKVAALPVGFWNYKSDPGTRHIGPMAQDFLAAFSLGSDGTRINAMDATGVALSAIQGLHELVKRQQEEIRKQRNEIEVLRARLDRLERR